MSTNDRKAKIENYGKDYERFVAFLDTVSDDQLKFKPAPDKWSGNEIIVHIADAEANSYVRLRRALAEPGAPVMPYDQDTWTKELNYGAQDVKMHLQLFKFLRELSYRLIKDMPEEKWQNYYSHPDYGKVGLEKWLDTYVAHVPGHIEQIKRNIAAMQS
jgi:hypothetical protein